jgi:chromosome segregation ATPase
MLKSEEIRAHLEKLQAKFEVTEADRDNWYDELARVQERFDDAEALMEEIEEEIYDLEDELEEALAEEAAGDQEELDRYHASKDKRQEDLDL